MCAHKLWRLQFAQPWPERSRSCKSSRYFPLQLNHLTNTLKACNTSCSKTKKKDSEQEDWHVEGEVREQNLGHRINASVTSQRRTLKGVTGSQLPNIFSFPLCECLFFQGLVLSVPLPFSARFAFFGCQGRLPPYMVKQTMGNVCGAVSGRLWPCLCLTYTCRMQMQ